MSIVPKETVEVIAQSIGINNLSPDAALALAPDVEYRIREIIQEGIKCMHHSKRTTLTTDDVDSALSMRNVEPIYGFASGDPLKFKKALGHNDLFYLDDKDVDFKDVIEAPLPRAPLDTSLFCHWLAIEGVQPAIPENAPVEVIVALPETKKAEQKSEELAYDIRYPVKHVLSRELQLYFSKITDLALSKPDSALFKQALVSLATDSGLHPLVPYFTCFIEDEVFRGLNNFHMLFALMRLVWSLLQNPHINVEPYLHQLMPPILTCIVAKKLGNRIADNHWELRDFSAKLAATICKRFGRNYSSLQTRLTNTLLNSFLDRKRTLTQNYGAVQGLAALGPRVVRLLLLPNIQTYLGFLEEILLQNQKQEIIRHEAWRVYGALLLAAGKSVYDLLKLFPIFPSPPPHSFWKINTRVVASSETHKRKADTEELGQQPSPKKTVTDGPLVSPSNNNTTITPGETSANAGEPDPQTSSAQMQTDSGDVKDNNIQGQMQIDDSDVKDNDTQGRMQTDDGDVKDNNTQGGMQVNDGDVKDNDTQGRMQTDDGDVKDNNTQGQMRTDDGDVKDNKTQGRKDSRYGLKTPAYLKQVWKDDLNAGHVVSSLFEVFGEGIMSFIPAPEMSLFL